MAGKGGRWLLHWLCKQQANCHFSAAGWWEKLIGSDRHTEGILGGWMKTDNMMSRAQGDDVDWGEEREGEGVGCGGEERTRVGS